MVAWARTPDLPFQNSMHGASVTYCAKRVSQPTGIYILEDELQKLLDKPDFY